MNDKIIELKNRYVPANFALDHLVDCARKGGCTVAGAHKVLWDFLECAAALTAAQPAAQEPVAYMVFWGVKEKRPHYPAYNTREIAELAASQIKSDTEIRPLYATIAQSVEPAKQQSQDALDAARLLKALRAAQRAIDSMKQSAETAGAAGDKLMLQEACESISNEGLVAFTAINAAIAARGAK